MRVRPLGEGRGERGDLVQVDALNNSILVANTRGAAGAKGRGGGNSRGSAGSGTGAGVDTHRFDFEGVCDDGVDNESLQRTVGRPLVEAVCAGYNGTLFTYGQTGSGKTYTIGETDKVGTAHEGVAHRMVRELYAELAQMHCKQYKVHVQFVQVYMESVHDLLADGADGGNGGGGTRLQLREDKTHGVYVEGAQSAAAPSAAACLEVLAAASRNLRFASTKMNRQSSRSHAVCRLFVEVHHSESETAHSEPNPGRIGALEGARGTCDGRANGTGTGPGAGGAGVEGVAPLAADGFDADLEGWRTRSIGSIEETLERRAAAVATTSATLTMCDLAVRRSGSIPAAHCPLSLPALPVSYPSPAVHPDVA